MRPQLPMGTEMPKQGGFGKQALGGMPERSPVASPVRAPMAKPLGSFKKGGKVPKTGVYKLHEGEQVVPKAQVALAGSKKKKGSGRVPHKMIAEQMDDNSFQITHEHKSDSPDQVAPKPEKFTAANPKQLLKHVRATYNTPEM